MRSRGPDLALYIFKNKICSLNKAERLPRASLPVLPNPAILSILDLSFPLNLTL